MEIRIGISQSARELSFDSKLGSKELTDLIQQAIENKSALLKLEDDKGKTILVPTAAIAYVEIGTDKARSVGFLS
jgi:hypothetical protein